MKDGTFTADRLLALYNRVAEAEGAIPRLRRFVLDLAVRGKLVEQNASDEPAEELLKRIAKEKAKGKKSAAVLPKAESPEALGKIPSSWIVVPLIGIGSWAIGSGFPKNEQGVEDGPYFFLKVSDMNLDGNEKFITVSNNYIDEDAAQRMRAKIHPAGTIIFPKIGGAIATNKRRILSREAAIDNNCLGITFASEVNPDWAFLLMTSIDMAEYQVGTAVPALQQGVLEKIAVALPPLAEQHRIVAKVDELMALCDQLEQARAGREAVRDRLTTSSLARLTATETDAEAFQSHARFAMQTLPTLTIRPDQIKTLRQAILNLAVRGKLVEQVLTDEPAAELHKTLAEEFKKIQMPTGRGKRSEASGIIAEPPFDVPALWSWVQMGDLGQTNIGLTYSPSNVGPTGLPVLRSNNVQNGKIDLNNLVRVDFEPKTSAMVAEGDMLICARNGSRSLVGKAALIERLAEPMAFGAFMALFRSPINPYLHLFLASPVFRQVIDEVNTTTINQITQANLRSTLVPLPPLAEQHRIVAKVDELMALCDQLEASLTTTATTRSKLLTALLHEALNGALGSLPEAAA